MHVLQLIIEGCSVSCTERISGLHRDTILKIMVIAGEKCEALWRRLIVNVPVKDVECDEMWGFIQKKEGHKGPEERTTRTARRCVLLRRIETNTSSF